MDFDIATLMSEASLWEMAGYFSAGVVTVGVAGEGITELTNWIKSPPLKRFIERASVLVLLLGLTGEILSQVQANNKNSLIVGVLNERAAKAELELAKIRLPRSLSAEQQANSVEAKIIFQTRICRFALSWCGGELCIRRNKGTI